MDEWMDITVIQYHMMWTSSVYNLSKSFLKQKQKIEKLQIDFR